LTPADERDVEVLELMAICYEEPTVGQERPEDSLEGSLRWCSADTS